MHKIFLKKHEISLIKNLHNCERKNHMGYNIESLNRIKPQEFWKHIQNLKVKNKESKGCEI